MTSGRRWTPIAKEYVPERTNYGWWVIDEDDPTARAWFKTVNPTKSNMSSMYSFGIERAVTVLGLQLGLPVPEVYLEAVDGDDGLASMLVPGSAWETLSDETIRACLFADRAEWPVYMAFDVLMANLDRHSENIFVEWNSPIRRRPVEGEQAALWLIDHGWSGLWPVYKFGENLGHRDLEDIRPDADVREDYVLRIRNNTPPKYRLAFPPLGSEERTQAIAKVKEITDDDIRGAVAEVPDNYMTERAKDITCGLLCDRLGRIDTLVDAVFPM